MLCQMISIWNSGHSNQCFMHQFSALANIFLYPFTPWKSPFILGGSFLSHNPGCKDVSQGAFKIKVSTFFPLEAVIRMAEFLTCSQVWEGQSSLGSPHLQYPILPLMFHMLPSDKSVFKLQITWPTFVGLALHLGTYEALVIY